MSLILMEGQFRAQQEEDPLLLIACELGVMQTHHVLLVFGISGGSHSEFLLGVLHSFDFRIVFMFVSLKRKKIFLKKSDFISQRTIGGDNQFSSPLRLMPKGFISGIHTYSTDKKNSLKYVCVCCDAS